MKANVTNGNLIPFVRQTFIKEKRAQRKNDKKDTLEKRTKN